MRLPFLFTIYILYFLLHSGVYFGANFRRQNLVIKILDVGQGDSTLITTPSGKHMLIDGGGDYTADWLYFSETRKPSCFIDLVILTHEHDDHKVGLDRILERCKVGMYKKLYKGDTLVIDEVSIKVLWPEKGYSSSDLNDLSTVVLLDYGKFEALFTGDAGSKIFSRLDENVLKESIQGDLDLYKVPHHGSRTGLNRAFLYEYKPLASVIPVGKDNKFGHPHQETLEFLSLLGGDIYRTDIHGTVEMKAF